jgi:hypothetical protein
MRELESSAFIRGGATNSTALFVLSMSPFHLGRPEKVGEYYARAQLRAKAEPPPSNSLEDFATEAGRIFVGARNK